MTDDDCICAGNWRLLVKEYEPLFGKQFRDSDGKKWTFYGLVHTQDDYYFGMWRKGKSRLLSCVGDLTGFGYTQVPTTQGDAKQIEPSAVSIIAADQEGK